MSEAIEPDKWEEFLKDFSSRNQDRRARFNVFFTSGEAVEEAEEGHLKNVALKKDRDNTQVVVERIDRSNQEESAMTDTIDHVRGIAVQYEKDRSENILELTDNKNTLISLRFESKMDGTS